MKTETLCSKCSRLTGHPSGVCVLCQPDWPNEPRSTQPNPIHAAHTPGPWRAGGAVGRTIIAADGMAVMGITRAPDELDANAKLIADAPRLAAVNGELVAVMKQVSAALSPLVEALGYAEWGSDAHAEEILSKIVSHYYKPLEAARIALAKATGGAQ